MRSWNRTLHFILLCSLGLSPTLFAIISDTHPAEENIDQIVFVILFVVAFCWFRITFAYHIGKGAERRKSGYGWWVFATCFIGVFPVGIVYWLFVHRKPIVTSITISGQTETPR
jgi:membrane protease YdiL (CAAX protease family)